MRILADTNIFVWYALNEPMDRRMVDSIQGEHTERFLSAASVVEIYRHHRRGVIVEDPDEWMPSALAAWKVLPITAAIARQSVLFNWTHHDPGDRLIAATALVEKVELWHTDRELKRLHRDFPARYFRRRESE